MIWFVAMIGAAAFMRGGPMWRTWGALIAASLAAYALPYMEAYVLIDLAAAAVVMMDPKGKCQRAIAALFAFMMLFELGFVASPQMNEYVVYRVGLILGWVQWAILLGWGLHERFFTNSGAGRWTVGPALAHKRDID